MMDNSSQKIRRVAIIGGGIAGLGMAACLKQMKTGVEEVCVYDPHEDLVDYNIGGAVMLSGGAVILEQLGLMSELKKFSQPVERVVVSDDDRVLVNLNLQEIAQWMPGSIRDTTSPSGRGSSRESGGSTGMQPMLYSTRWAALRQVLYDYSMKASKDLHKLQSYELAGSEEDIAKTKVTYHTRMKLQHLHEETDSEGEREGSRGGPVRGGGEGKGESSGGDGKVTLFFNNGHRESGFDLVIGADGMNSVVRGFVQFPHETILHAFPLLRRLLPSSMIDIQGNLSTGLRITQCVTPHRDAREIVRDAATATGGATSATGGIFTPSSTLTSRISGQKPASSGSGRNPEETLTDSLHQCCVGEMHHWIGNGCDAITTAMGDRDVNEGERGREPHYVLSLIYREGAYEIKSVNPTWKAMKSVTKDEVKRRLNASGYNNYHVLHSILEATCQSVEESQSKGSSGGNNISGTLIDIGIRDNAIPLRSWSSKSGRVILIGDSAHTTAPFLGQGANQALQDAFCLSGFISKYNHNMPLTSLNMEFPSVVRRRRFVAMIIAGMIMVSTRIMKFFFDRFQFLIHRPSKMQMMAYKFEKTRKFQTTILTIAARIMGYIETMGSPLGIFIKCLIFRVLAVTGAAAYLFFRPMKPVV